MVYQRGELWFDSFAEREKDREDARRRHRRSERRAVGATICLGVGLFLVFGAGLAWAVLP